METYNWDTVFAITLEHANKALAFGHDQLLPTFSCSVQGYQFDGAFGRWQIMASQAGKLLHIELPIQSGKMVDPQGKSVDLAGTAVVVEVTLALLPDKADTSKQHLQFNFKAVGDNPGDPTPGLVKGLTVKDPEKRLLSGQGALLKQAIPLCLVNNAASISYVFGTINLIKPATNSWLTPVKSDYYFAKVEGSNSGYLAILSVTDDRDITTLDRKIDPSLLDGAGSGFFAISGEMLLKHVVQPSLPSVFHGTSAQTFTYNASAKCIQNTSWFGTDAVTVDLGIGRFPYYPHINNLLITVLNTGLACSINGSCDMGLGISCTFSVHSQSLLQYNDHTKSLSFARDATPIVSHDFDIPVYDRLLPGIMGIGELILDLVVKLVSDGIANGLQQNAASFSLAQDPPQSIQWDGMAGFDITAAGLANCFYMRGELGEPAPAKFAFSKTVDGDQIDIVGTFGPWHWQSAPGGDDNLLWMTIPIPQSTLTFKGKIYSLANVNATIEVRRALLPQPGAVEILEVKYEQDYGFMEEAVFRVLLRDWFNQNLEILSHALATIDLQTTRR